MKKAINVVGLFIIFVLVGNVLGYLIDKYLSKPESRYIQSKQNETNIRLITPVAIKPDYSSIYFNHEEWQSIREYQYNSKSKNTFDSLGAGADIKLQTAMINLAKIKSLLEKSQSPKWKHQKIQTGDKQIAAHVLSLSDDIAWQSEQILEIIKNAEIKKGKIIKKWQRH